MDLEQACPKCKTTLYRNPNMKLMVNTCGHNLCESCVELLFARGTGACPECGVALRRTNFRIQLFEDASIDKEVDIRRRILRDFNKKEEDFETLQDYNDYLEMVEDIIFNLSNNIDIVETNKKIQEYKELNRDFINKTRHRKSKETLVLEDMLAEENRLSHFRNQETQREQMEEKKIKAQNKEKLIDDLMFSDADANAIVSEHEKTAAATTTAIPTYKSRLQDSGSGSVPLVIEEEAKPFVYQPPTLHLDGPLAPSKEEMNQVGYCDFIRSVGTCETAGGFTRHTPCSRALEEAFCGLFFAHQ